MINSISPSEKFLNQEQLTSSNHNIEVVKNVSTILNQDQLAVSSTSIEIVKNVSPLLNQDIMKEQTEQNNKK